VGSQEMGKTRFFLYYGNLVSEFYENQCVRRPLAPPLDHSLLDALAALPVCRPRMPATDRRSRPGWALVRAIGAARRPQPQIPSARAVPNLGTMFDGGASKQQALECTIEVHWGDQPTLCFRGPIPLKPRSRALRSRLLPRLQPFLTTLLLIHRLWNENRP
jgi:hypothetical protein